MSLPRLVKACIAQGTPAPFLKVRESQVEADEMPLYLTVRQHVLRHSAMPSEETLRELGRALPHRASESAAFYLERIAHRGAYNEVNELNTAYVDAMSSRNMPKLRETIRAMAACLGSVEGGYAFTTLANEIDGVLQDYTFARENPGLRGITFGYNYLDALTQGAQGGDVIVVAGRPSMGKSWMLLKMAFSAWLSGRSIGFLSMEMSLRQIVRRWLALLTRINPNFIRAGELSTWVEDEMVAAVEELRGTGSNICLLSGDFDKNAGGVEEMVEQHDPDIIYVDAMYLLSPIAKKQGYVSKWENIAEVMGDMKRIALSRDKPVVVSVQLNRNQKSSGKKEMDLSDIAGSDSIPQDASIVLFLRQGMAPFEKTQREGVIMKNREGELGQWYYNHLFSPINFDEIIEQPSAILANSDWMV